MEEVVAANLSLANDDIDSDAVDLAVADGGAEDDATIQS